MRQKKAFSGNKRKRVALIGALAAMSQQRPDGRFVQGFCIMNWHSGMAEKMS